MQEWPSLNSVIDALQELFPLNARKLLENLYPLATEIAPTATREASFAQTAGDVLLVPSNTIHIPQVPCTLLKTNVSAAMLISCIISQV
jgi:hypothetical protein